jgi:threonine dehydratase
MTDIKILSRVEEGFQYYLLVDFFQKQGALKDFIIDCLSSEDEILNIEYTRKSNREKGPAIVGIECQKPSNFDVIKQKMAQRSISYRILSPGEPLFNLLL